jgi:hypothetical protein
MTDPCAHACRLSSPSIEILDWGYARNRRAVLMTTSAEWSQSVYSCPFESHGKRLIAPNRDYPYEGLLAHQDGENWKILDCIALGLRDGSGGFLKLEADPDGPAVTLDPWQVTYAYRAQGAVQVPLRVTYYLASPAGPEATTGCVSVYVPAGPARRGLPLTLVVQPFLDIRHMYSESDVAGYRLHTDERGFLVVTGRKRSIVFHLPPGTVNVFGTPELVDWTYKLGTGSRHEVLREPTGRMETCFVPERKQVAALFNLEAPVSEGRLLLRLPFQCGLSDKPIEGVRALRRQLRRSRRGDREQLRSLESAFPLDPDLPFRDAILARIVGLTKLGIFVRRPGGGYAKIPSAGGWWFKTPWYRDVFEGILNSLETLMRLPDERARVREVLDVALSCFDGSSGLLIARLPELQGDRPPFNSSDATLLCLLAAHMYAANAGDAGLGRRALDQTLATLACFRRNASFPDGPPRLDAETGLLLSVPHHSWIDTSSLAVEYAGWKIEGVSNRASARFVKDLYDRLGDKIAVEAAFEKPGFFLPEINAQWIAVLSGLLDTFDRVSPGSGGRREVEDLLARARASFKPVFWNPDSGFLFNMVHESREVRDAIECEAAVTSAALLGETVFSREELRSIWRHAERTLLVYRTLQVYGSERLPFGLLTQNADQRVYYDDDQYHADVVWPRSTPYLIGLLARLGETETIRGLLVNNLDHQMSEGALFYNQELFSRPCGNNPAPEERTRDNPVPVKNPIQFWSQWCDPYIRFFSEGNGHG